MRPTNSGFTAVEAVTSISIVALLLILMLPAAGRTRNADGLQVSIANLSRIMQATQQYHFDHAGRTPLRACGYNNGQLTGGWDAWSVGGKNCSTFWAGQVFDEPANCRFLNPYLYQARIPAPPGYVNTGSGSTWRLVHGTPTPQQRASLQIPVFKSPGDVASCQQSWPNPNPAISCYDDVGTSYVTNMKWWDFVHGPTFAAKYEEGLRRINQAFDGANPNYVFMHDQTADIVAAHGAGFQTLGEFGKLNSSVMGFADGRVAYTRVVSIYKATYGPGYNFLP